MLDLSSLAFRSLASNALRTAIVFGAVLLSVAAFTAVQLANDAIGRGLEESWRVNIGVAQLQATSVAVVGFPDAALIRVRALSEVVAAAQIARKRVFYAAGDDRSFIELVGVDPVAEQQVRSYRLEAGSFVDDADPTGIVLQGGWARSRDLQVGDSLDLMTQDGLQRFQVRGLLAADAAGVATYGQTLLVPLDAARQTFGLANHVSAISLLLTGDGAISQVRGALPAALGQSAAVRSAQDLRAEAAQSTGELQGSLTLFSLVALFVALFLILNTIEMAVAEQLQQTGRLRALGATQTQILGYFLVQGLAPGVAGAVFGTLAGSGMAFAFAALIGSSQQVTVAPIEFSVPLALLSAGVGVVVVAVAAFSPALRASRMNPIEMIQGGETGAEGIGWRIVLLGVGLVVLSLVGLMEPGQGSLARLLRGPLLVLLLTGLVLASRAVVPPLSAMLGVPFRGLGGSAGRLAALNLTRHIGRTAMTVAGFMVSLSLLVAVASLALSSAHAGERWVASLIPSELVVVSSVEQPPIFVAQFAGLPDVVYASPVSFFTAQSGRTVLQVAAVDPAVLGPHLQATNELSPAAAARFAAGGAVLVPRRLAELRGLEPGDTLELQTTSGPRPFLIAGVIEHSFPSADRTSTVLLPRADAAASFDSTGFSLLMVQPRPGADSDAARSEVAELADRYGMSAITADEISSEVAVAIFRLLALLAALVGIGLVVSAFGTANTMLMNVAERRRELIVLWAAGMPRSQLQLMTLLEAIMMGLLGGVLGTLVGGVASVVLVGLMRTASFEPQYEFPLPVAVVGIVVAMLASAIAALAPARQVAMMEGG